MRIFLALLILLGSLSVSASELDRRFSVPTSPSLNTFSGYPDSSAQNNAIYLKFLSLRDVERRYEDAEILISQLAETGDANALYLEGMHHLLGYTKLVEDEPSKPDADAESRGYQILEKAMELGSREAAFEVARHQILKGSVSKGRLMMEELAKDDFGRAHGYLAGSYLHGFGESRYSKSK